MPIVAMLWLGACFGQRSFMLGAKGGIDIPNLRAGGGDNPVSKGWSSRLGPYMGIVVVYNLTPKFSIQAEFNYSSQGAKKNGKQAIPTVDFTDNPPPGTPEFIWGNLKNETKLNYIELPVLARFKILAGHSIQLVAASGLYFGYLAAAREVAKGNTNFYADEGETMPLLPGPLSFDEDQDIKGSIKKFNMGLQADIGLSVPAPLGEFTFTIGGNLGFIPVQKDKANGQNVTGAANITVGYLFKL